MKIMKTQILERNFDVLDPLGESALRPAHACGDEMEEKQKISPHFPLSDRGIKSITSPSIRRFPEDLCHLRVLEHHEL
jgi:hypothetical protein